MFGFIKKHSVFVFGFVFLTGCGASPVIDSGKVEYSCNFDIHRYLYEPGEFEASNLSQGFLWILQNVHGKLLHGVGGKLAKSFEREIFKTRVIPNKIERITIWGVSSDKTYNKKNYLIILNSQKKFKIFEIPEPDRTRFSLEGNEYKQLLNSNCKL